MKYFFVYVLRCSDDSYYVGHTDDIEKRVTEHKIGYGSPYTASRLPVMLVFVQRFSSREEAFTAERKIKGWRREKKEALITGAWPTLPILAKKRFNIN